MPQLTIASQPPRAARSCGNCAHYLCSAEAATFDGEPEPADAAAEGICLSALTRVAVVNLCDSWHPEGADELPLRPVHVEAPVAALRC